MVVSASVAIPTCQRSALVLHALQSIIAQHTNFAFEVLVLDNGCDKALQGEVEQIAEQTVVPVRYIPVPEIGLHNARHAGVEEAKSDILVFVDDDIVAAEGWLQAIVDTFDDSDVHLVGGRSVPRYDEAPPPWLEAFWTRNPDGNGWCDLLSLADYGDEEREIDPMFIWGVNFAIRKKTLVSLGGFHPDNVPWELRRYRGDGESAVSREVKRLGLRAVYQPAAVVYHVVPRSRLTVEYFERRSYLQGISDSYTRIRLDHGLVTSRIPGWKSLLRKLKRLVKVGLQLSSPDPYQEIKARVRRAYQAGREFHQNEVRRDPELLKWVLRKNYWDGRLPGFQKRP